MKTYGVFLSDGSRVLVRATSATEAIVAACSLGVFPQQDETFVGNALRGDRQQPETAERRDEMRAAVIHRTARGVQLQGRNGEPVQLDGEAMRMILQRQMKKRLVPLEHNGGQPIRRVVRNESDPFRIGE